MFSAVKNAKAVLISYFHSYNSFSYAEKKQKHYGICAPTFASTLTMANFPAGWPRLSAKIH